ncbi:DEAD/DEAH box helicase [Candidatus Saccharibacteria bacterium]|nr:DEAD/DEAH box helicase [Candidatus Saccharibacteria bacterium]
MYKNTYNRPKPRRAGVQSFGPNRRQRGKKADKSIDPARFVKAADPELNSDYETTHEFADFSMHPLLKANITAKGYIIPSEIQDKTIALGLAGRDVVGIANTGTGKTAAFALPILNKLMHSPGMSALIVAPTRELAIQIEEQCKLLAKSSGLSGALLIGGVPISGQMNQLRKQPRIIIGTPGRIKDHLNQRTLTLSNCHMVVLDEVDRMLDMGFINDVRDILSNLPTEHQAFFFSATMSPEIRRLIETFASDPEVINVKQGETSQNVNQDVVYFSGKDNKMDVLHDLLISEDVTKALIFGKTKYGVERLGKMLKTRGFKVDSLHGGKSQGQRKRALDAFRDNSITILVATDVAARGIDVKDISHVINFDQPQSYEDYVHRIGRAGRAGKAGHALTFVEK